MFIEFMKRCRGYVRVRVSGFSPERFMNLCGSRGILLWQVNRQQCFDGADDVYEMCMSIRDFMCLRPILRKTKTKVSIIGKYGFPFFAHRYQKRKLFPVGILFCAVFLFIMSLFLWEIQIEGNVSRTDDVIMDYIAELGVAPGILKKDIVCERIEKGLRQEFDDITWTSARIQGTCLEIQIKENMLPAVDVSEKTVCDLVAEKAGTVVEIITRTGVPLCVHDMEVERGDVLVSGSIPIKDDSGTIIDYRYVAADADIRMKTVYQYRDSFPLRTIEREYTGKERIGLFLATEEEIFYLPKRKHSFSLYDTYMTEQQLPLFKDVKLPVYVGISHVREYYEVSRKYTEEAAYDLAAAKIQKYCADLIEKGVQIITNSVKIDFVGNQCQAAGAIYVIETAGRESPISVITEDTK